MVQAAEYRIGRVRVRSATREVLLDGRPAKLGGRAFDLLLALIERRDRIVSKSELLDIVWTGQVVEENNLEVQVLALRKLLGQQSIATVPGRGYRLVAEGVTDRPDQSDTQSAAVPAQGVPAVVEAAAPLFGREDDLNTLEALVLAHRLVTVVGVGGIGKTTVARALAHRVRGAFEGGACTVELAPVSDPTLVATSVATALPLKLGSRAPLEAIAQAVGARRTLIVLDNCEHLLQAVAELVEALASSLAGVRWLVTSQEPLKVHAEQIFRMGPLALPNEDSVPAARQAGAVTLFEARAQAADPHFTLSDDNVGAAIEICRRLDGIALAIELAAARVPLLGIEGLRSHLDERFRVLTSGDRLALPRHQTLLAALEWSHGLLTAPQQVVFRRLGVFAGSFSLGVAQQVAADDSIDQWAVLDALGALVDKSLVVAEPDRAGEPRYRLLETMRHFALDRLGAAGDGDATRTRHLDTFVALAELAKRESYGQRQAPLMRRLDLDLENLLAAHAWSGHMAGGGERDLRLVGGLLRYWLNRSQLSLGYRLTREALGRTAVAGDDRLRRTALTIAGQLGGQLGLHDQARKMHDEAIDIARRDGDPEELADALNGSGQTRVEQGDLAGARTQIEESLKLATQVGTDSQTFGTAALMLGELERLEGNWIRAQSLYEASLSIARRQGDARRIATNLNNLVMNSIALARSDGVREMLVEAMQHGQQVSIVYGPVFPLMLCAGLATLRGDWEVAARFEGAARFHFAELQWPLDPADRAYLESLSSRTRTALGDSGFGRAREAGRALALDEALAQVRQYLSDQT